MNEKQPPGATELSKDVGFCWVGIFPTPVLRTLLKCRDCKAVPGCSVQVLLAFLLFQEKALVCSCQLNDFKWHLELIKVSCARWDTQSYDPPSDFHKGFQRKSRRQVVSLRHENMKLNVAFFMRITLKKCTCWCQVASIINSTDYLPKCYFSKQA